jgi:general secretion pathway protein B
MSFILDALRKSETERQRDAAVSLHRAPMATVRQRTPLWSFVLIGFLSVALVAFVAVWWLGDSLFVAAGTGPEPPAAIAENAERDFRPMQAAPPAPLIATQTPTQAPASLVPPPIRPVRDLATLDPGLPRLRLELLAYNGRDPAGGSAWINGERYFIGDRVANGPELVEVMPDGVILAFAGERFLLTTR